MAVAQQSTIRYTKAPISAKIKVGGRMVVSSALVKPGSTNLLPRLHVKRGDMVMLISGPDKDDKKRDKEEKKKLDQKNIYKGQIGKVLSVSPKTGKILIEGVNVVTRATKQKSLTGKSGLIKKENPIFASRVMLYCTACKKPTRIKNRTLENGKKSRVCRHCNEAFDA